MPSIKIACLGAGSLYFPRAIADVLVEERLSGSTLTLYDLDGEKASLMAGMGRRLAERAGTRCTVRAATDLADAVDGATFALTSIGGSGAQTTASVYGSSFHDADVRIPAKYGIAQIIGDTCGPAGLMMGLRSIPACLEIARQMEKRCPSVILFNHSNPMAPIMRALHKYTSLNAYGVCHGVQGGIIEAARLLEVPPEELQCTWIGTNHYYWFTRILHHGRDLHGELLRRIAGTKETAGKKLSSLLSEAYGHAIVYREDSHVIEFYPYLAQLGPERRLPYGLAHHQEPVAADLPASDAGAGRSSSNSREEFLREYRAILDRTALPARASDPLTGEGIAAILAAIATGQRQVCILNVANKGAVPNLPIEAEIEVEALTDSGGARAVVMGEAPAVLKGMLEKRFVWHELVADAAVKGDRGLALQALLVDEMAIRPDRAAEMLDELLTASRDLLPRFFGPGAGRRP